MFEIIHNDFGNNKEYLVPNYACLLEKDKGLENYYEQVLNKPFDKKRFRRPGCFRNIGTIEEKSNFSLFPKIIKCLDMPIKMSGDNQYRIPNELHRFIEPIEKVISFEHKHNSAILNFYAYLTIDQTITKGEYHRKPGLHVDGFQGARIEPKVICDRSYIATNCDCPVVYNQGFETVEDIDDSKYNIFHEFDRTKHYSSAIKTNPFDIYFMDCYLVHEAGIAEHAKRTFFRLSYSTRQYDRLGNSHNNCFDYEWNMVERNIQKGLM